jgi:acyl-CoA synthetase (AMP-forming)/AMP-acid ligase II
MRSLGSRGGWTFTTYQQLADRVRALSADFRRAGLQRNGAVMLSLPSGEDFTACFFAALHAGGTPCPVMPPRPFQQGQAYRTHLRGLVGVARPDLLVTDAALRDRIGPEPLAGAVGAVLVIDGGEAPPSQANPVAAAAALTGAPAEPADHALLQFTSGSSGRPKAVRVPRNALERNIAAIRGWLAMTDQSVTSTWLPVYHDMGLIGCLLTPVVNTSDVWVMRPEHFLRDPLAWLETFGRHGAGITAVPNFGLAHVVQRVAPEALAGLDLSRWAVAIVGAERIEPAVLDAFVDLLAPAGFRRSALCPAYGLAEACLAVTGLPMAAEPAQVRVATLGRVIGESLLVVEPGAGEATEYVGCGVPLGGGTVEVVGEDGTPLPEDTLGEILVRSDMVADGYLGAADDDDTFNVAGLRTGDAGFWHGGQLHVVGRLGDCLKRQAVTVFAEELEALLRDSLGERARTPVVLLGAHRGVDTAVVLLDPKAGDVRDEVVALLDRRLPGLTVAVVGARRSDVLLTSSGKPRRRAMWSAFVAGELGQQPAAPPPS